MKVKFKYSNGDTVIEKVTGFKGVVTAAVCYMTGCNQYLVTSRSEKENKEATVLWYDEGRLELIQKESIKKESLKAEENGCDIPAPIK